MYILYTDYRLVNVLVCYGHSRLNWGGGGRGGRKMILGGGGHCLI